MNAACVVFIWFHLQLTIKQEDRNDVIICRNIDISKGLRCCKTHTIKKYLKKEALFALTSWKTDRQVFDYDYVINIIQKLWTIFYNNKYLDFDNPFCLSETILPVSHEHNTIVFFHIFHRLF